MLITPAGPQELVPVKFWRGRIGKARLRRAARLSNSALLSFGVSLGFREVARREVEYDRDPLVSLRSKTS
jgi:hypothetical protein